MVDLAGWARERVITSVIPAADSMLTIRQKERQFGTVRIPSMAWPWQCIGRSRAQCWVHLHSHSSLTGSLQHNCNIHESGMAGIGPVLPTSLDVRSKSSGSSPLSHRCGASLSLTFAIPLQLLAPVLAIKAKRKQLANQVPVVYLMLLLVGGAPVLGFYLLRCYTMCLLGWVSIEQ